MTAIGVIFLKVLKKGYLKIILEGVLRVGLRTVVGNLSHGWHEKGFKVAH